VRPEQNVSLAPHTSLRVGGPADWFVLAHSASELTEALRWARARAAPVHVIGGGSNLLVAETGVEGLVIKTANSRFEVHGEVVRADAGTTLANMARRLAKQGWGGLEWAANVPGTVGGAVVNNAGAFGGATAGCVDSIRIVDADGRLRELAADDLDYGYRTSVLKRRAIGDDAPRVEAEPESSDRSGHARPVDALGDLGGLAVVDATFKLQRSTPEQADGRVKEFNAQRMASQPRILSAGSVFANPEGDFAGRLIEQAGLKGRWVGGAQISEQHANFIVNPSAASASDVYALLRCAQQAVFESAGVWLSPEIELLGRWSDEQRRACRPDEQAHTDHA
jgi:UDP-N-acetylmuramate dehydrogenase